MNKARIKNMFQLQIMKYEVLRLKDKALINDAEEQELSDLFDEADSYVEKLHNLSDLITDKIDNYKGINNENTKPKINGSDVLQSTINGGNQED